MEISTPAYIIFGLCAAAVVYVYAGYPLLVHLIGRLFPRPVSKARIEPSVSVIITAHNEEKDIRRKIENTLDLDYPREKFQVIVASDCSTDRTDEIVKDFTQQGVALVRQHSRQGKTAAQNLAVESASGEIILFSDATSAYQPDVVRRIVPNFADRSVGCVAGRLVYVDPGSTAVGSAARSYWSYESLLKQAESRACSLIGVSGCLYAVRRENYKPMYPEACSDFLIATVVRRQGLRTVYEPDAVCTEETNRQSRKELGMRIRIISQTFTDLWRNRDMMNPFRAGFYALQLVSHKLLRYSVPLFLLGMLLASAAGAAAGSYFFLAAFAAQVLFYLGALAAAVLDSLGIRLGLLAIPLYFVMTNIASIAGFLQFLRGERYASWEPIRDSEQIVQ